MYYHQWNTLHEIFVPVILFILRYSATSVFPSADRLIWIPRSANTNGSPHQTHRCGQWHLPWQQLQIRKKNFKIWYRSRWCQGFVWQKWLCWLIGATKKMGKNLRGFGETRARRKPTTYHKHPTTGHMCPIGTWKGNLYVRFSVKTKNKSQNDTSIAM